MLGAAEPTGALAVALLPFLRDLGARPLFYVARSDARAEALARVLRAFDPALCVTIFPPWDNLPYDRAPPSRAVMGKRAGVLRWLTDRRSPPDLVLTTPAALIQRTPPQHVWAAAHTEFRVGDALDPDAVEQRLRAIGYVIDERVDEPGEAAIRGRVVDLFPAAAPMPCRVEHDEGRITAIRSYDPVTQRSIAETDVLAVDPASEMIGATEEGAPDREGGGEAERSLAEFYPRLQTALDYVPDAPLLLEDEARARADAVLEGIADAWESRTSLRAAARTGRAVPPPERLYLTAEEWERAVADRLVATVGPPSDVDRVPPFARERNPARHFAEFLLGQRKGGARLVLCAGDKRNARSLGRRAEAALGAKTEPVADWAGVLAAPKGSLLTLSAPLEAGFVLPALGVAAVAAADLLGSRAHAGDAENADPLLPIGETELRLGDAVVHIDHGMGVLEGLEEVAAGLAGAGDTIRLRYARNAKLMVPVAEIGKIWRYGSQAEAVSLDHLDGNGWAKRRAQVEAQIDAAAARMVELARIRAATPAPKLVPPARDYERFAARFPHVLTRDQAAAIDAVLTDLASGRPMDRLVCGDVGFGKTEVALRAAAAAVLAGKQVAVIAPTTVLVRQHVSTFRRRFAPFGITVANLSRLVTGTQARKVREGLASGDIRLVVGTHALAGKGVRFEDLGLLVIDEEQRFGARDKEKLRRHAKGAHVLTLTATPIPRTLQSALVGLEDLSVIATAPVRRQPIRTVLAPFDPASLRDALLREHRRGGQSFVVCPRVEDIAPMAERLREIVPALAIAIAHGKMPPEEMDDVMVRFAEGDGDILLATNIIESGLDVPSANTMLIWRPDRFGIAQLHQLRGRVGRGARRGLAYLLTDPAHPLPPASEKRLRTLEALDRLGAGFAISARDLDLRGAGDLLGEEQAGHVELIGLGLYQHVLAKALAAARGEAADEGAPEIRLGLSGRIPQDYVPEPEVRINLYARLDALRSAEAIAAFEDEIDDRFGPHPESLVHLFLLAQLRASCRELGIVRLDGGPQAIAASFHTAPPAKARARIAAAHRDLEWRGERLIYPKGSTDPDGRARLAEAFLRRLGATL